METISQDILEVERGVICHQVNCQGRMGAGLALQIRDRWPIVYKDYRKYKERWQLGMVQFVKVTDAALYVCNLAGQWNYGRAKPAQGIIYTDYEAVRTGLNQVNDWSTENALPVYIPSGMSCGLAGGDWNIIQVIIEQECPHAIICRKPEGG
ncbi:hypothetical protein H6F78_25110 [Coleofasciculus sp. FACHB-64]|uniref:hypothetical protein n=1 Tax=Cyanophyceae TaxID=3028117 RepID=UPI00168315FD|nr:hypothetical protein [Coleofasciculus sp. FACHB-64]MBD2048838.1 hypothetical protein [Coleofasciculus sp. FACHB-64]